MIETHKVRVVVLEACGDDIATLRLERPAGYSFRAGQWTRLTLQTPGGPDTRTFTLAGSPTDGWLEITTRRSPSAFKQALFALAEGDEAEVSAAGGRFALPDGDRFAALIGGVGITPVHSMLRSAVADGRTFADGLLVYGNRDDSCEPYLDEFESMVESGVRVVRVLERPPAGWEGESGFITPEIVMRHVDPADGRPFVVSGPPVMVVAMAAVLDALGVSQERRHVESFGPMPSKTNATGT